MMPAEHGHETRTRSGGNTAGSPVPPSQYPISNIQSSILHTPLAATVCVVLGMSALAIPLIRLTSAPAPSHHRPTDIADETTTPCWISLKLLEPARSASLSHPDGRVLWSAEQLGAGETEARVKLPIDHERTGLILDLEFSDPDKESAAFLTIAPDHLEDATRHLIGTGKVRELLEFSWHSH